MKKARAAQVQPLPAAPVEDVSVISPDGVVGTIASDELSSALETGYQSATPETLAENAQKNKYGKGVVNKLEAAALGAARGLSFGLSDVALRHLSPDSADAAEKLKRYNPNASLAGELGSFAVPSLGGLGAFGKAASKAGLLQTLVGEGGSGLAAVAKKIVGDNLAGTAIGSAAKLAAESAVYNAAHNLSEDALQDKDLTAESIIAGTGHAMILGAGMGAAIPLAAKAAQATASAIADSRPFKYITDKATRSFANFFDPDRSLQLYSGAGQNGALFKDSIKGEKFRESVKDLYDKGFYDKGTVEADLATGGFKKTANAFMPPTQAESFTRLDKAQDVIGNAIGDILKDADAAIGQSKISLNDPIWAAASPQAVKDIKAFQRKFINDVGFMSPNGEAEIRKKIADFALNGEIDNNTGLYQMLDSYKGLIEMKGGSLEGLQDLKKGIYARIKNVGFEQAGSPEVQTLKAIARQVKENIDFGVELLKNETAFRGVANKIASVAKLNETWGQLQTIRGPIDAARAAAEKNVNFMGLRIRDMGASAIGGAMLGPVGALSGFANKTLQTDNGLLIRAAVGEKLKSLAWAEGLTNKGQADIAGALKAFLTKGDAAEGAAKAVGRVSGPIAYALTEPAKPADRIKAQQDWFTTTQKQIVAVTANPEQFAAKQGAELQGLANGAPGLADALLSKQLQVYAYLQNAMPKNPGMPNNIFADKWKPADYEIMKFRKIVQVARAPITVLTDMHNGTLTKPQVDAVKELYPKLYESMLNHVRAAVTSPKSDIDYNQQMKLGALFPGTVPTMAPQFCAAMMSPAAQPKKDGMTKPGGHVQLGKNSMTELERVSSR